jgi:cell division protein FtsI/penicillin-binding protein 2
MRYKFKINIVSQVRITLFKYLIIGIGIVVLGRMFQQQVLRHSYYFVLAKGQQVVTEQLPSNRGEIFVKDSDGKIYPLVKNKSLYKVLVIPNQIDNQQKTVDRLAKFLKLTKKEKQKLLDDILNRKFYIPPLKRIKNNQTILLDSVQKEKFEKLNLPGVILIESKVRYYPEGSLASQILGYIDADGHGQYGIEGYFDEELRGVPGRAELEKNVVGQKIADDNYITPKDGVNIVLSIDRTVQEFVEEVLARHIQKNQAEGGSVIIMEPKTGRVVAMANYPTYNPYYYYRITNYDILNNAAVAKAWEPGSVFKPIVMAAALDAGKVTPETSEIFPGSVVIDDRRIWNSIRRAWGKETMVEVLQHSDNIGMIWVGQKLGKKLLYKYLYDFGFGMQTGVGLGAESAGQIKPLEKLLDVDAAVITFGQGISVTPLQLAVAYSAIANGGKLMQPYIVDTFIYPDGREVKTQPKFIRQVISAKTAATLTAMLTAVVESKNFVKLKDYYMAGKTGTASIPTPYGYSTQGTIGSFACYAPVNNPRFVLIVKMDKPKTTEWGELSAGPLASEISDWLLKYYYRVPPDKVKE